MKLNSTLGMALSIVIIFMNLIILLPIDLYAQEDTTPPVLVDFSFSPTTVNVATGAATVIATFHVTDDISGFSNSGVNFRSSSGLQTAGTSTSTLISGTANDGIYQSVITIQQFAEEGTWVVSAVHLYDEVGNGVTYLTDQLETLGFPTDLEVVSSPVYSCAGLEPPCDSTDVALMVKKNKCIPLKTELIDENGVPITDSDIEFPPVLALINFAGAAIPSDVATVDGLPPSQATDGNQFEFIGGRWCFNLKVKDYYTAPGTYTFEIMTGNQEEYVIEPTGTVTIVVEK